jgi:NosR/NirI family nitrous oxide reductase transcriptional regulator
MFLDLMVVDLGPPSVARAALSASGFAELEEFLTISRHDEPILAMDYDRRGLLSPDFIRNTALDGLLARQDGLPVALRGANLLMDLSSGVPEPAAYVIVRTDRRLGFDPIAEWELAVRALRAHGSFRLDIGSPDFTILSQSPDRFFAAPAAAVRRPVWVEALLERHVDLAVLGVGQSAVAVFKRFAALRLVTLTGVIVFIGWWEQGQLSIVTPLAALRAG